MALTNYFERVYGSRVNFDTSFSTNLRDVLTDIDENFQRILAAPFFQGPQGNNVEVRPEYLYVIDPGTQEPTDEFTPFGIQFIETIWPDKDFINVTTYQDLINYVFSNEAIEGVYPCEALNPNGTNSITSIDYYYLQGAPDRGAFIGITWFQDARIQYLSSNNNTDFIDYSCALYGTLSGTSWTINRYAILPLIYWDTDMNSFCWRLNGENTQITCQGVKGEQGEPATVWVVKATRYPDDTHSQNTYICIWNVLSCSNNDPNFNPSIENIHPGDLVYAWFTDKEHDDVNWTDLGWTGDPTNFTVGLAKIHGSANTQKYIEYSPSMDLSVICGQFTLRSELNKIGGDVSDNMRGLYIPNNGTSSPTSSDEVTMMYTTENNSDNELHIAKAVYTNTELLGFAGNEIIISPNLKLRQDSNDVKSLPLFNPGNEFDAISPTNVEYRKETYENANILYDILTNKDTPSAISIESKVSSDKNHDAEHHISAQETDFYTGDISLEDSSSQHPVINGDGTQSEGQPGYQMLAKTNTSWRDGMPIIGSFNLMGLFNGTLDEYFFTNVFNFTPATSKAGTSYNYQRTDVSNFNMRYMTHVGLSSGVWKLALCMNTNAKLSKRGDDLCIDFPLPSMRLIKDVSSNNWTNIERDNRSNFCFGDGTAHYKNYDHSIPDVHEIISIKETPFVSISNVEMRPTTWISQENNANYPLCGEYLIRETDPNDHTVRGSYRFGRNINENYFTMQLAGNILSNIQAGDSIIIYKWKDEWNPLFNIRLKSPIAVYDETSEKHLLGNTMGFVGLAAKKIDNTNKVQFVFLWSKTDEESVIQNTSNGSTDAVYLNEDSTVSFIKRDLSTTPADGTFRPYYSSGLQNLLAYSYIIEFDNLSDPSEIIRIYPVNDNIISQAATDSNWGWNASTGNRGLDMCNWCYVGWIGQTDWSSLQNKIYIESPSSWEIVAMTDYITTKTVDAVPYDFYSIDLGTGSISTRTKRENLPYTKIFDNFSDGGKNDYCCAYYRNIPTMLHEANAGSFWNPQIVNMNDNLYPKKQNFGQTIFDVIGRGFDMNDVNGFMERSLQSNSNQIRTVLQMTDMSLTNSQIAINAAESVVDNPNQFTNVKSVETQS